MAKRRDVNTLGTAATFAFGINQNTEIAGFGRVGGAGSPFHAFKWYNGVFTDLGTLGGNESFAHDINARAASSAKAKSTQIFPG